MGKPVGKGLEPAEKDKIDLIHLTVGDLVTKIREASERLIEDNASSQLLRLASRFDDFAHLASSDHWRSELSFVAMVFGISGSTLGREFKESSPTTKKEIMESLKSILLRITQHMVTKDWNQIHTDLRDLYAAVHKVEWTT